MSYVIMFLRFVNLTTYVVSRTLHNCIECLLIGKDIKSVLIDNYNAFLDDINELKEQYK